MGKFQADLSRRVSHTIEVEGLLTACDIIEKTPVFGRTGLNTIITLLGEEAAVTL